MTERRRPLSISINALGGQGGGVLANWIVALGETNDYIAQATSVPGVAQRTGATIYCVELFPRQWAKEQGQDPVLSLMPVPGDVDIVIASEWMEAARAITRGFVTKDLTALIASTHRDYAIEEKSALQDGRKDSSIILEAIQNHARTALAFDMQTLSQKMNCPLSAVLFGALAQSNALPFPQRAYEQVLKNDGRSLESNLKGFKAGMTAPSLFDKSTTTASVQEGLPHDIKDLVEEGRTRLHDFQDKAYADEYLQELTAIQKLDSMERNHALSRAMARHLALWMSYEDIIRIADLKSRAARHKAISADCEKRGADIVHIIDYFHPRFEEIRDCLPYRFGAWLERSHLPKKLLQKLMHKGHQLKSTSISGYLLLRFLSSLRPIRRTTYRHCIEMRDMGHWLNLVKTTAEADYELAVEITKLQSLIKGYSDTHRRGHQNFKLILNALDHLNHDKATTLRKLRKAALSDDHGTALHHEMDSAGIATKR